jgi:hypothetical protein
MNWGFLPEQTEEEAFAILRAQAEQMQWEAYAEGRKDEREEWCQRYCSCPAPEECRLKKCECAEIDEADRHFPKE